MRGVAQEPEPDERFVQQAAWAEIRVCPGDDLIEISDLVAQLSADPAHKQVTERRHDTQNYRRSVLGPAVCLPERRQHDVALPHGVAAGWRTRLAG